MSLHETDLIERLHAMAEAFEMPPAPPADDVRRGRRRVRRNRGAVAGAVAVAVAVVLGGTALGSLSRAAPDVLEPAEGSGSGLRGVPVWYDAKGLHHGDVVEQTPVDILRPERPVGPDSAAPAKGALALVRSGALYLHPATGDVWFHPWGGEPRVVGRNSGAGPGGDPNGNTAAWFDGRELVVYDTAAGRELSRTTQTVGPSDSSGIGGDHYPAGNGFLYVSAEQVVWTGGAEVYRFDVRSGVSSTVVVAGDRYLIDIRGDVLVQGERDPSRPVLSVPGQADRRFPDLSTHSRLSPSGRYLLSPAAQGVGASIVNTETGDEWRIVENRYPWIAWSYGGVALVDTESELLACDAGLRECETLPAQRPFLMPTN